MASNEEKQALFNKEENLLEIQDLDELFEAFSLFDKNCNGIITNDEILLTMRSIGLNPTNLEMKDMISEVDTDLHLRSDIAKSEGDHEEKKPPYGVIDFPEFLAFLSRKSIPITDEHFSMFKSKKAEPTASDSNSSSNKDGIITVDSLVDVLRSIGEPVEEKDYKNRVTEIFKEAQFGDDGINFKDFMSMMNPKNYSNS